MSTTTTQGRNRSPLTPEKRRERAAGLQASIVDQVQQLRDSGRWRAFLDFAASFHTYSFNNVVLLLAQTGGTATRVAGYRQWEAKGRQVRKGARSLKIFGYSTKKTGDTDPTTGEETRRIIYPILSVFDISATDPIPGAEDHSALAHPLTGDDKQGVVEAVTAHLTRLGWTVAREPVAGGANGYATADASRRVVIDSELSPAMAAKVTLHEAAHVTLGHTETDHGDYAAHRGVMETEAESVAYVLAGLLGLDTSAYSIGYIAGWADADVELIRSTATRVLGAVHTLAQALFGETEPEHTG
jgi:antirestriction protein ArdC